MNYWISVDNHWYAAPLQTDDADYLREVVEPALEPLSDSDYRAGPARILSTAARFSYVLDGDHVFWCVEWSPGLLVVRIGPGEQLARAVLVSPNPEFAGRKATEEELDAWHEDDPNPQYNLVFHPWDAQFDTDDREYRGFVPARPDQVAAWERAMAHVNGVGAQPPTTHSS